MYRCLFFYRFTCKFKCIDSLNSVQNRRFWTFTSYFLSSHNPDEIASFNMESQEEKLDVGKSSKDSTCNSTYAQVLSKGCSDITDTSNNNPFNTSETINGNENVPIGFVDENSATNEIASKDVDSCIVELSHTDSFEDAEDSQNINSSATLKSSDLMPNTSDETSPLVTAIDDNNSKSNDQNNESQSSELSESGEEADLEDDAVIIDELYPSAMKWRLRADTEFDLPETVTVLETSFGSKVFVVGTAHFSKESQEDVAKTIKAVQPDVVMIELCKSRVNILSLDEETILEESKNMNFQKIKAAMEQNGFLQGALYLLLLNMSAHLTKQLGMAPGGEFRRAFLEAKQIPGCLVHLGDRPIHITLQRALATLSWWQKLRIAWYMLRAKDPISKEEVERCKQKDLLEEMLAEMTGEFPELSHVFVKERDIYLTYSLQMSALTVPSPHNNDVVCPSYVVGVVGIGHVPGIKENWGKINEKDIHPILRVPEPSLSSKIIRQSIRISVIGLGMYGVYKVLPKSWIPSNPLHFISYFKR